MRVAVAGSSGLIGTALCTALTERGDEVVRLVRRTTQSRAEITWNPRSGDIDSDRFINIDAVVNLAGAGVGDHRWTQEYKREIRESRVDGTHTLATAIAERANDISVFIAASAIGYYGDRGSEELTEESSKGTGFLSDVVADWEAAAQPARDAGVRVVHPRTGLVASADGGAWQRMLPLFRCGLGGKLGSGNQYWSFISLRDEIRALLHLIDTGDLSGPVNLTAPTPVTNRVVTKTLGEALHRPTIAAVPSFALKTALGEFSTEVLSSSRVLPARLEASGFSWQDPTIVDVTNSLVGS